MEKKHRKQIIEERIQDIETCVRRHGELVLLLLSLMLGMAGTCLYAEYVREPEPVPVEQTAWWGGLYPEYCVPGTDSKEVRVQFRYLAFLNKMVDSSQVRRDR